MTIKMRDSSKMLHGLWTLAGLLPRGGVVVEIGSFAGESTEVFLRHPLNVIAIDPWDKEIMATICDGVALVDPQDVMRGAFGDEGCDVAEIERAFDQRVGSFPNLVAKLKGTDDQFCDLFRHVDSVYIDSIHTYEETIATINRWADKVTHSLCGHDYGYCFPGVKQAVHEAGMRLGWPLRLFPDSSWMLEVK